MDNKKKLMVIDGNSLMHRAFYAIQGLTNKKGFLPMRYMDSLIYC